MADAAPLTVISPGKVAVKCPCGGRPQASINVMSMNARAETACVDCGRRFVIRSSLAGVKAQEATS